MILGAREFSQPCLEIVQDPATELLLSSVSAWEIAVKYSLGHLPLPENPATYVPRQRGLHRVASLALDEEDALAGNRLPRIHRDPFDRMLICQAIVHGLTILTPDEAIRRYPVRTFW